MTTSNLLLIPISSLATLCADFAYTMTRDELRDYFRSELMIDPDATLDTRDELIDALDRDIRDMLHNCNLDMLFPPNDIDALDRLNPNANDDTHDMLADRILQHADDFIPMIADRILSRP